MVELRYTGGLAAVEVDHQVVKRGGTVEVPRDRVKDMVATGEWERVPSRDDDEPKPKRTRTTKQADAQPSADEKGDD